MEQEGAGEAEDSGNSLRGVTEEAAVTVAEAPAEDELDQGEAVVQEAIEEAVVEEAVLVDDEACIEDL